MNWQEMVKALERSGLTQTEIAEITGCSQGHISDIKTGRRGKGLRYEIGKKLESLWQEQCEKQTP